MTVVISNGRVAYEDRIRQREWTFDDLQLELVWAADSVAVEARANAPEALGGRIRRLRAARFRRPARSERERLEAVRRSTEPEPRGVAGLAPGIVGTARGRRGGCLFLVGSHRRPRPAGHVGVGVRRFASGAVRRRPRLRTRRDDVEWSRLEAGWALSVSNLDLRRGGRVWPSGVGLDLRVGEDERACRRWNCAAVFSAWRTCRRWCPSCPRARPPTCGRTSSPGGAEPGAAVPGPGAGVLELFRRGAPGRVGAGLPRPMAGVDGPFRTIAHGFAQRTARPGDRDARLQWPARFPGPLEADELTGRLTWRRGPEGLRVVGDDLVLNNRDGRSRSTLALTWPAGSGPPTPALTWLAGSGRPTLALESRVTDFDAASARRYFPMGVVPRVSAYLERAVLGGRVPQAEIVFFGPLTPSPFDDGEGRLRARVQVEEGSWPTRRVGPSRRT